MKKTILKIVALLILATHLTSCFHHVKTDREYPGHNKYRKAGNYW